MIKKIITIILLKGIIFNLNAQSWQKASMNEDGTIHTEYVTTPVHHNDSKNTIEQLNGFPLSFVGNPSFKNMRNLSLADINGDGIDDIIFAIDNKLYVYTYQGLLWEAPLTGTAVYPPSIGDVTGNGEPEIVQVTGGIPANGRIHVFDKNGNPVNGWPVNLNNNWILCAPALSDLNGNGKMEIVVNERVNPIGNVHIFKHDGTSFSSNWPIALDGIPAITPSIADVDNDGEKDIVIYSTKSKYIFGLDGQIKSGFPHNTSPQQGYSYQSPIIADFDGDGTMEIVGSTHGDLPQYYIINHDNSNYLNWPKSVPGNNWTYSPATVVKINGQWQIFMSRPIGEQVEDMLYGWDPHGNLLSGFPISKSGGLEGIISVADITEDNNFELVFGSNLTDAGGYGFIHSYPISGGATEISGFPLRPKGFTFMNGVCIGDINGNGKINLVALSYSMNYGSSADSTYINVYELNTTYDEAKVLWGTYKGSNTRTGAYNEIIGNIDFVNKKIEKLFVFPNPVLDKATILWSSQNSGVGNLMVYDISGRLIFSKNTGFHATGEHSITLSTKELSAGNYKVVMYLDGFNIGSTGLIKN